MDEDAFVSAVRERLADYWSAFDRPDHSIVVTGVEAVDDGRWPEAEVAFVVVPDGGEPVPGTVRRPFGAQWRDLSFYDSPGRYARMLVQAVEHAALERLWWPGGRPARTPSSVPVDVAWRGFLTELGEYGVVREVAPGRIEITDENGRVLTFLITPEQWAEVVPEIEGLPLGLDELIGAGTGDEPFFVYDEGGFHRSVRAELPAVRDTTMERQLAAVRAREPQAEFYWATGTGPDADRLYGPRVRPRRPEDLPALAWELWAQQPVTRYPFRDPLPIPVEAFLHADDARGAFVVADDDRPLGQACWVDPPHGFSRAAEMNAACAAAYGCEVAELGWVTGFFVGLALRHRGLGRRLLAAVVDDLVAAGRRPCLEVLPVHPAALELYRSTGWRTVLTLRPDWLPAEAEEAVQVMVRS